MPQTTQLFCMSLNSSFAIELRPWFTQLGQRFNNSLFSRQYLFVISQRTSQLDCPIMAIE
jgi:hypothetical protein